MVIRTYIEKNNTIIKNSEVNTGRNPIAELYYGGQESTTDYTRHLLYFDVEGLQEKYNNGEFGDLSKLTHTLRMCKFTLIEIYTLKKVDEKQRTSSFDLLLFRVNQDWDEGTGYDYQRLVKLESDNNITYVETASNWFNATTLTPWSQEGVYSAETYCNFNGDTGSTCEGLTGYTTVTPVITGITVTTQHFDKGMKILKWI